MGGAVSSFKELYNSSNNISNLENRLRATKSNYSRAPTSKESKTYIALCDYKARSLKELSFSAQETFRILDHSDKSWWKAQSRKNNDVGYIPTTLIAESNTLSSKPWFFTNSTRREAESMLILSENKEGSFIIRDSETAGSKLSLSVKVENSVKHFRIKKDENGRVFVSKFKTFSSLDNLVEFYRKNDIGHMRIKLCKPCVRIYEPRTIDLAYSTIDKWEIDRNTIQLSEQIGQGNFGEVYDGIWNSKVRVAVKTLKPGTMQPTEFLAEAQIMKKLYHKHLIQLLAVCTLDEPIYIITEFMKNGSLLDYLRNKQGTVDHLEFHVLVNMAAQVASGMAFLEQNNYIHRDLAARNVLVGEKNLVKVSDFGLTRLIDEDIYTSGSSVMPVKWTAPEALTHRLFSIKSDVWSFGILLYELVTHGSKPYPSLTNQEAVVKIRNGYRMSKPPGCEEYLYKMMLDTWKKIPEERPTFESLQDKLDTHFTLGGSDYMELRFLTEQS